MHYTGKWYIDDGPGDSLFFYYPLLISFDFTIINVWSYVVIRTFSFLIIPSFFLLFFSGYHFGWTTDEEKRNGGGFTGLLLVS